MIRVFVFNLQTNAFWYNPYIPVKHTRHAAYEISYHFVWVPKYRRKVLVGDIPNRLISLIQEKTTELEGDVLNITVQPDHVHLFGCFPPTLAPYQIMHRIKGYTAFKLRDEFPHLKSRLPNMWTRSYYVGTAGSVSAQTIQRYIDAQKGKQIHLEAHLQIPPQSHKETAVCPGRCSLPDANGLQ